MPKDGKYFLSFQGDHASQKIGEIDVIKGAATVKYDKDGDLTELEGLSGGKLDWAMSKLERGGYMKFTTEDPEFEDPWDQAKYEREQPQQGSQEEDPEPTEDEMPDGEQEDSSEDQQEEPQEESEEGEPQANIYSPEMPRDPQMDAAIKVIRELLDEAKTKRQQEAEIQATTDMAALASQGAELAQETPKYIYISIDGDNIGNAVARAEETDDEKALADVSRRINAGQDAFRNWIQLNGGEMIEGGGDEALGKVPGQMISKVQEVKDAYEAVVGATATIGVGRKISESTKARMLGKLKGKNQIVVYDDGTPKEIELLMSEQGGQTEQKKLQAAGLAGKQK